MATSHRSARRVAILNASTRGEPLLRRPSRRPVHPAPPPDRLGTRSRHRARACRPPRGLGRVRRFSHARALASRDAHRRGRRHGGRARRRHRNPPFASTRSNRRRRARWRAFWRWFPSDAPQRTTRTEVRTATLAGDVVCGRAARERTRSSGGRVWTVCPNNLVRTIDTMCASTQYIQ